MRLIFVTIFLFAISAVALPLTLSIADPMIREIAMSGPGEPDLSKPRMIGKVGLGVTATSFVLALGFSIASIVQLPRGYRPLACFLTALLVAGIPCGIVIQGGPFNAAGDGGPNLLPLFVIAGAALVSLHFLIWSVASLFALKSKPRQLEMSSVTKSPAFFVTSAVLSLGIVGVMSLSEHTLFALSLLPFAITPLLVSLFLAAISPSGPSQTTIVIGSLLYAAWFGYFTLDAFYWHDDSYSAIQLIYVGICSLPVMIPVWIVSLALRHQSKTEEG